MQTSYTDDECSVMELMMMLIMMMMMMMMDFGDTE